MTTRPYFNAAGEQLIALILAGDKRALAEASHRSSRKVQAAVRTIKAQAPAAPKAPKAPARKTGPGSRGGDPTKAARAAKADAAGPRGSSAWWVAYRAAA
jgi:hypothetical protein